MAFPFAVKHNNGSFTVRQLGFHHTVEETKHFLPEGLKVMTQEQFERLQKTPEKLVAEVVGKPGPFAAWSLGGNPVVATTKHITAAASAIYAWEAAGRPDFVNSPSAIPGARGVPALSVVNNSLKILSWHLEKPATLRALAVATDAERTNMKDELTRLQKTITNMSGIGVLGGELGSTISAITVINRTKFAFGGHGATVGKMTVDPDRHVNFTFPREGKTVAAAINYLTLNYVT